MTTALIYFGVSAAVLLVLSLLFSFEDKRGQRLILVRVRSFLDAACLVTSRTFVSTFKVVHHALVQFILHHGVRRFLGVTVSYLRNLERRVEYAVLYNRQGARKLRKKDRNHLDEIADHKESVALTEEEKYRLKND